jgi:spore coat polysaccharide biosynthesis protein SpsF
MFSNVLTVIQTRSASSRLPNKILYPLMGKPLLVRMVERVKSAKLSEIVVVATTTNSEDDMIEEICYKEKICCFRGNPTDLLDRHYKVASLFGAEIIVKIPSDCPLIDPKIIDKVISYYLCHQSDFDFVSNLHPATYPDGNDVEIMPFNILEISWKKANKDFEREHTTPYIWDNPDIFRIGNVTWESGLNNSMTHRWTIDYEEDYIFINAIYNQLYEKNPAFGLYDILDLLKRKPILKEINNKFIGVNWYGHNLNELKTITMNETKLIA